MKARRRLGLTGSQAASRFSESPYLERIRQRQRRTPEIFGAVLFTSDPRGGHTRNYSTLNTHHTMTHRPSL